MAKSRSEYAVALKQAEAELASHDARGEALRAAVEALRGLVAATPAAPAPARKPATRRRKPAAKRKVVRRKAKAKAPVKKRTTGRKSAGAGHPQVPNNHYRGLGPTKAYDKFVAEFGDKYSVPQIRDALMMGGVKSSSATSLATGIHSVRRRRGVAAKGGKKSVAKKPAAKKVAAKKSGDAKAAS